MREKALEAVARPPLGADVAQEPGIVMDGENEAVDFEKQLPDVGIGAQMALANGGADRALERAPPCLHHGHEGVAHRARPVVELDGAADVDAARIDLDGDALEPAIEESMQARQAARLTHRRAKDLVLEARVVLAYDRDLQLLARAEEIGRASCRER